MSDQETVYSAILDLGPGFNSVMEAQIRKVLAASFTEERINRLVDEHVSARVKCIVDDEVSRTKSGWMSPEMKMYLFRRIEEQLGIPNLKAKIDEEFPKAWARFTDSRGESHRELDRLIKTTISDRIWQLARDGEGLKIVKESIEKLVLQSLQTMSDDFAGRAFMKFVREEGKK